MSQQTNLINTNKILKHTNLKNQRIKHLQPRALYLKLKENKNLNIGLESEIQLDKNYIITSEVERIINSPGLKINTDNLNLNYINSNKPHRVFKYENLSTTNATSSSKIKKINKKKEQTNNNNNQNNLKELTYNTESNNENNDNILKDDISPINKVTNTEKKQDEYK